MCIASVQGKGMRCLLVVVLVPWSACVNAGAVG